MKLVTSFLTVEGLVGQDVGVTGIEDDHGSAAEETTASSSHLDVVARKVVDGDLAEHGVV